MQEVAYDARGEHIARRSVPAGEGTPEDEILHDVYEHDAVGREVRHTTPWGAVVKTDHDRLRAEVTESASSTCWRAPAGVPPPRP
ncbi:hypothetical protein WMF37_50920 [Sorangium sp. So ce291]|uniref:hypothetical protein n=1 Tax=Sorangium sp. So ce291 TaxID=3133294 RepID=UPI003F617790